MRIRVEHDIDKLAADLLLVAATAKAKMPGIVARNAKQGNRTAQSIARAASGPHGAHYFKRLSAEAVGPLSWEYGPHAPKTNYVGVSGSAGAMRDLVASAKKQAPKFQRDVADLADGLFWP